MPSLEWQRTLAGESAWIYCPMSATGFPKKAIITISAWKIHGASRALSNPTLNISNDREFIQYKDLFGSWRSLFSILLKKFVVP